MMKLLMLGGFISCLAAVIGLLNCVIFTAHLGELTTINSELGAQYECGFIPFGDARLQFEVQFYLISLLFVVFDVEVALLLPYSLVTNELGYHGFYLLVSFFVLLGLGFIAEWQSGILNMTRLKGPNRATEQGGSTGTSTDSYIVTNAVADMLDT